MAIPDFQSFFYPVLKYSSEHNEISLNEIREFLTEYFSLTEEDKAERVPSGTQTKFDNRINWTKSYFSKAKLIENTKRSHFKITDRGRNFLTNFSDYISINDLKAIREFREFNEGTSLTDEQNTTIAKTIPTIETKTPLESLEESYQFIKRELASELLEKIRENSWQFFEDLVIDLMIKMGYGGSRNKAGESIKRTNDEGIDGIINEDKLGLDVIYLQAKMWKEETSIGRPEIQKFVGALHGQRAKKGVFITTSSFAKTAVDYVKSIDPKVILIDGETLTNLMIEYNVGVAPIETYQIKKIDLDYFE
ncbi:MAG: restriction endonuclease [Bacteroidales bacterium]|nr:restriction endonuclease [Bacteroidales bacterium]MCK9499932.1 restriction endonuclease [Bacteroidales bacterium]